jgi:NAD(P)-dependent dehydrogenase (short-subunit alcohol dehydrogenase family)
VLNDIHEKVILVTGAAKRIGRGIALRLAREGARVAIHYGGSEQEARATANECGGAPIFQANLESVPEIMRLYDEVSGHFGHIDGVVNNAARFTRFDPLDISEADWDYVHSVNLKAVFFSCQQAAKRMIERGEGGRIVNISSLGGIKPWAHHAHYCASKAGVIHMTRALAKAFGPHRITVNSIAPGVIEFGDPLNERAARLISQTPVQRSGTADEIADAVVFFLRSSDYITGQLMAVDGGLSQR